MTQTSAFQQPKDRRFQTEKPKTVTAKDRDGTALVGSQAEEDKTGNTASEMQGSIVLSLGFSTWPRCASQVTVVHGVLEVPPGGVPRGVQTGQGTGERAQGETRPRRPGRSRETGQEGPGHQGTGARGPTQPMRGACGVCGVLKAEAQ